MRPTPRETECPRGQLAFGCLYFIADQASEVSTVTGRWLYNSDKPPVLSITEDTETPGVSCSECVHAGKGRNLEERESRKTAEKQPQQLAPKPSPRELI